MVNGVPRDVPRPKPEGPQAPRVLGRGTSQGNPFTMIHPRLFHTFLFFCHPGLVKRDFFHWRQIQPLPREYHGQCYSAEEQTLVEFNPHILVRDVERMKHHEVSEHFRRCPGSPRKIRKAQHPNNIKQTNKIQWL